MKSVWVIEQGSYSDYTAVGVFSSKENAELVAKAIRESGPFDEPSVDEWTLNPMVEDLRAGRSLFSVTMKSDGTAGDVEKTAPGVGTKITAHFNKESLSGYVWAKNGKHAIKIVNEKRIQMIAAGELE